MRRDTKGRHRIQETRGQTAKAAIAQTGIQFLVTQFFQVDPQLAHGHFNIFFLAQIEHVITEQAADQKFHG